MPIAKAEKRGTQEIPSHVTEVQHRVSGIFIFLIEFCCHVGWWKSTRRKGHYIICLHPHLYNITVCVVQIDNGRLLNKLGPKTRKSVTMLRALILSLSYLIGSIQCRPCNFCVKTCNNLYYVKIYA